MPHLQACVCWLFLIKKSWSVSASFPCSLLMLRGASWMSDSSLVCQSLVLGSVLAFCWVAELMLEKCLNYRHLIPVWVLWSSGWNVGRLTQVPGRKNWADCSLTTASYHPGVMGAWEGNHSDYAGLIFGAPLVNQCSRLNTYSRWSWERL